VISARLRITEIQPVIGQAASLLVEIVVPLSQCSKQVGKPCHIKITQRRKFFDPLIESSAFFRPQCPIGAESRQNSNALAVHSGFDMNPSPGNIRDGLVTDAMKSAGAARKGGTSPVTRALDDPEYSWGSGYISSALRGTTWNALQPRSARARI
jgi:hypothetical protein